MELLPPALALVLLCGSLAAPAAAQRPEDEATRIFALPMVRETRELASVAEEHIAAQRWPEAIAVLQRILDEHSNEVLPPFGTALGTGSTYPGAAEWALARLLELPDDAREVYRARYAQRADEALERARRSPDRALLAAIPRRWPVVPAAAGAWWALGDLELEAGQPEAAAIAWGRAVELSRALGLDLAPAAARVAWLAEHAQAPGPVDAAAARHAAVPPRGDAQPWVRPLDMTPFAERAPLRSAHCVQPVSNGDVLLVGTTLRLYALDAFSGELRWEAGPPRGWGLLGASSAQARLFEGLNYEQILLAPAIGSNVAVAVMQQPFTEHESDQWQGIEIMTSIPERRLHAYDLATGRELWNHAPELRQERGKLTWSGGGTWPQRMMIAGSPVVAGERVLVPSYRMQGRIDYHVACYEIATGELLWSTQLISGQRERNMFGRSVKEFCASPVVVSGDRVIAQTELGTLAALDLVSGRILWQTTYRQIALPKTRSYTAPDREITWKVAPPVVVGDVIVATPSDSEDIVAVRRSDGAKLWEYSQNGLKRLDHDTELLSFDLLVGADQDSIYLTGSKLSALHKPGGLASSAPFRPRWTRPLSRSDTAPRPLLTDKTVVAANSQQRLVLDRRDGKEVPALTGGWNGGDAGNLWLEEGAMFAVSNSGACGFFDWRAQLDRARVLAQGSDPAALRTAAELFLRRGRLSLSDHDLSAARAEVEEARRIFARLRTLPGVTPSPATTRSELAAARTLADALAGLQRTDEALATLADARTLAATREELASVLFQEERFLHGRDDPRRIAVLDAIEAAWGDRPLPDDTRAEAVPAWLAGLGGAQGLEPSDDPIPTGVWVALERAGARVRAGELGPAFEDLHLALERSAGHALARGVPLAAVARERIGLVLALPGARQAYASIEARAARLLDEVRGAGTAAELARVAELYPHSRAAEEALALRLERALAAHDAAAVAEIVRAALARDSLAPEREDELLLRLARLLAEQGNAELERGFLVELARLRPLAVSPLAAHGGRTLAELARTAEDAAPDVAPAPVLFDAKLLPSGNQLLGAHTFLGALRPARQPAEGSPSELHLYATRDELLAFSNTAPATPAWHHAFARPFDVDAPCALAPGRFVYATGTDLVCLDDAGEERWRAELGDAVRGMAAGGGLVIALTRANGAVALDLAQGIALWERSLGTAGAWTGPVLGPAHAVFFAQSSSQAPRAVAVDLFRGRVTADWRLEGFDARSALARTAWIDGRRLVAPSFHLRPSLLAGFELEDGARAWRIEFGEDEELVGIVHSKGTAFAVTLASSLTQQRNGGIYRIDAANGSYRDVVKLKAGEHVMGLDAQESVELTTPYLFTYRSEERHGVPVRSILLPHGKASDWSLQIGSEELYDYRRLPMPAVSRECVAIAYHATRAGGGKEARVVFLDHDGRLQDTLVLGGAFAQASRIELRGLGSALFVNGRSASSVGNGLEILESSR